MKPIGVHNYFVYILTNINKNVLYIGVTNDLKNRLYFHRNSNKHFSFTSKYKCFFLIYYERFEQINQAIEREKQLKSWNRRKKENLINSFNPDWIFLNDEV